MIHFETHERSLNKIFTFIDAISFKFLPLSRALLFANKAINDTMTDRKYFFHSSFTLSFHRLFICLRVIIAGIEF